MIKVHKKNFVLVVYTSIIAVLSPSIAVVHTCFVSGVIYYNLLHRNYLKDWALFKTFSHNEGAQYSSIDRMLYSVCIAFNIRLKLCRRDADLQQCCWRMSRTRIWCWPKDARVSALEKQVLQLQKLLKNQQRPVFSTIQGIPRGKNIVIFLFQFAVYF